MLITNILVRSQAPQRMFIITFFDVIVDKCDTPYVVTDVYEKSVPKTPPLLALPKVLIVITIMAPNKISTAVYEL
jgi:hypothetical protein